MLKFAALLILGVSSQSFGFTPNQNYIACQKGAGVFIDHCKVNPTELAPTQAVESDFFVSYSMSCSHGSAGPEKSSVVLSLPNGKSVNLNVNQPLLPNVHVGTGFGPLTLEDLSPDELLADRYKDCKLVITELRIEMSAAELAKRNAEAAAVREKHTQILNSLRRDMEFNRNMIMNIQPNLFFRIGQKQQLGCLIKTWMGDTLYEEMVEDAKNKFEGAFGEFKDSDFDCSSKTFPQLTNDGMACSDYTSEGIQKALANMAISQSSRNFFETCGLEKSYSDLLGWYQRQSQEIASILDQLKSEQLPDILEEMNSLKSQVDDMLRKSCTAQTCSVEVIDAKAVK